MEQWFHVWIYMDLSLESTNCSHSCACLELLAVNRSTCNVFGANSHVSQFLPNRLGPSPRTTNKGALVAVWPCTHYNTLTQILVVLSTHKAHLNVASDIKETLAPVSISMLTMQSSIYINGRCITVSMRPYMTYSRVLGVRLMFFFLHSTNWFSPRAFPHTSLFALALTCLLHVPYFPHEWQRILCQTCT